MMYKASLRSLVGHFVLVMAFLSLSASVAAQDAAPDPDSPEAKREQARIDRVWNLEWRRIAAFYVKHDRQLIYVPGYDRRLPSSAGITPQAYQKENTLEQEYTDERGKERTRTLTKPDEDAVAAANALAEVAPGQYGYIHSGHIERIADDKTVELEDIWLLDAEAMSEEKEKLKEEARKRFAEDVEDSFRDAFRGRGGRREGGGVWRRRTAELESIDWAFEDREAAASRQRGRAFSSYTWRIVGYKTTNLTADARWPAGKAAEKGLQLVVAEVDGDTVIAYPAATVGRDITVLDMLNHLEARGMTTAQFVDMVTEAKRESREDYLAIVLAKLEGIDPGFAEAKDEEKDVPNNEVELAE